MWHFEILKKGSWALENTFFLLHKVFFSIVKEKKTSVPEEKRRQNAEKTSKGPSNLYTVFHTLVLQMLILQL